MGFYEDLASNVPLEERVEHNIEKDLDRTVPEMKGERKASLRRVLRALAVFFRGEIGGYVQGLNYLSATILYHVQEEASAFWIMVQLLKRYGFVEFYKKQMPGLEAFFVVLSQSLEMHAPALARHFQTEDISTNMFSMKWALTLFGCKSQIADSTAIMDVFLVVGWDAAIFFSLALLISSQDTLLTLPSEDILFRIEAIPTSFPLLDTLSLASLLMHRTQKTKLKNAFLNTLSSLSSSVPSLPSPRGDSLPASPSSSSSPLASSSSSTSSASELTISAS